MSTYKSYKNKKYFIWQMVVYSNWPRGPSQICALRLNRHKWWWWWWWSRRAREAARSETELWLNRPWRATQRGRRPSFTKYLKRKTTWLWTPEKMAHRSEVLLFKLIGLLRQFSSSAEFSSYAVLAELETVKIEFGINIKLTL